jgi:hypothetical protein
MAVDGKDLVRRYLEEVFSEGRLEAMDTHLSGDKFKNGVAELVTRWRTAFMISTRPSRRRTRTAIE